MNSRDEDNFEDQWQRILAGATEQPSTALWQRIEQDLDKADDKIVPVWYNYVKYIAAAALVLVSLGGYWTMKHGQKQATTIVTAEPNKKQIIERRITIENPIIRKTKNSKSKNILTEPVVGTYSIRPTMTQQPTIGTYSISPTMTQQPTVGTYSISPTMTQQPTVGTYSIRPQSQAITISELDIKDLKNLTEPAQNQLIVFFKENFSIKDPVVKWRKHWISFGASIASFNPHLSLPLNNNWLPYSYSNVQQQSAPSNVNEGTIPSFLVQISGGMKVRGRLGVESGIGFLMGNSVYETSILTIDNRQISAIADALSNSAIISNLTNKQIATQHTTILGPVPTTNGNFGTQKIRNDYQFVQIPLLLSYDIIPTNQKIGVVVVAGITSSIMLQNHIQNINQQDIIYKNSEFTPYNRLSFASTFGLRGNYKLSQSWAMTLTANYQKAIQSIEKSTVYFTAKPQLFGVGLGLQYQF